jgi:EmrB/QacA subfamily drug resistance transporter
MTATQRWTMVGTVLGSAIVFLDGTIVNVALKVIGEQLPATIVGVLEGQTYVVSGYLATLAALLILAGALGDYYGRRKVFAIGLAGFGTTSVMCGLAPNLELLALFRVLQGATGALLVPGSLSIITATFEGPARARAFGIWAAATSATTAVGPLVGGYLVDAVSWRAAFLLNAPLVVLALYATLTKMNESRDEQASGRFDWLGAFVGVVAVGGLAFGGIRGQDKQWQDPLAFLALGVGAVAMVAFPILMAVRPDPLVPLSLFRRRAFAVINLSTLLIYGALYVTFGFQGLFLQGTLGYTAFGAGATGLPVSILLTVLSTRVGTLAGRFGPRVFLVAGPLIMAAGLLWLARIPPSSEPWLANPSAPSTLVPPASVLVDVLPSIVLFGIGISLVVAPLTSTLMDSVPVRYAGLGSAINNAVSRVGQPLLSAVVFIALSQTFYSDLVRLVPGLPVDSPEIRRQLTPLNRPPNQLPQEVRAAARIASTDSFHVAVLVGAGLLVAGAAVNGVGLRPGRPPREGDQPREGHEPRESDEPARTA